MQIRFQMRQSPYGRYAGPYGYNRYQPGNAFGSMGAHDLFWNDRSR
jgi:hypothetical protein